jgi:amino acid transporter
MQPCRLQTYNALHFQTGIIGGRWLKYWTGAGAVISSIGMFEAQMSSGAFQLLGMADLGLLPAVFARRAARTGTPWVAIVASTAVTIAVSFLGFDDVVATANFLYSLGTLLEFASFLWLRAKHPELKRPYRVPLPLPALAAAVMLLAFSALLALRLSHGQHPPCACFGSWSAKPLSWRHLARNAALFAIAAVAVVA